MNDFHEMQIWKRSRCLLMEIFLLSNKFPSGKYPGLCEALRQSSIAIPANIARAFSQSDAIQSARLLDLSRGCVNNVGTYLSEAKEHQLIDLAEFEHVNHDLIELTGMLAAFNHHSPGFTVNEQGEPQ